MTEQQERSLLEMVIDNVMEICEGYKESTHLGIDEFLEDVHHEIDWLEGRRDYLNRNESTK